MEHNFEPGVIALLRSETISTTYVVGIVERLDSGGVVVKQLVPAEPSRTVTVASDELVALSALERGSIRADGVRFHQGDRALQSVNGGYQIVAASGDITTEPVALVRIWIPNGDQVMGMTMSTPTDVLIDPADMRAQALHSAHRG